MGPKKLIVVAGILAAALVGACGGKGTPHRLGVYGPAPAPFLSLQNVNGAQPGYQGVAQITSVNGQLYYSPPDGGFAPVGSGSGGGGFSNNVTVQAPTDGGVAVNAAFFLTTASGAPDAATGQVNIETPVAGTIVPHFIGSSNLAGAQKVTTASATQTVTWLPGADTLQVTLGTGLTKLVVNGFDCDAEGAIDVEFQATPASAAETDLKLNDTDATGVVGGFNQNASTVTAFNANHLILADAFANPWSSIAHLRCNVGKAKIFESSMNDNASHYETYEGVSTVTADVTSFSISNQSSGGVLTFRRPRPSSK